ncbi:MAG: tetratricopeptide repeat protein [Lentisphaerae bacterium]|nr:tetratricopeptide repeat protein [Lentisphaerota bacterium]
MSIFSIRFLVVIVCAAVLSGAVCLADSAAYRIRSLTAAEYSEAAGWASYARAKYLLNSRSSDLEAIAGHLVGALMSLPDALQPFQLLVFLRGTSKDMGALAADLGKIAKVHPEHSFINIAYSEALSNSGQATAGIAHLRAFLERCAWQDVPAAVALLEMTQARSLEEADKLLRLLLRKPIRNDARLRLCQAEFVLRAAVKRSADLPPEARAASLEAAKAESRAILQQIVNEPSSRSQWDVFMALLPALGRLELWDELNTLLDSCSEEFKDTQLWYEHKLIVLQKLEDRTALQALAAKLLSLPELPNDLLERIALAYQELQDYAQAREIYERLHFRNLPVLHYRLQLAWLYLMEGKAKMGLALLTPVRELPFRGWLLQAALWRSLDEPEKALQSYAQAEKVALAAADSVELNHSFYTSYGLIAENLGKIEQALALFRKAYQLSPDNPDVCNCLGYTLADYQRELPFAAELIDKAIKAEPDNVAFLDSLAWVRFRQQDFSAALEAMIRTLQLMQSGFDADGIISKHAAEIFAANGLQLMADFFQLQAEWNIQEQEQR